MVVRPPVRPPLPPPRSGRLRTADRRGRGAAGRGGPRRVACGAPTAARPGRADVCGAPADVAAVGARTGRSGSADDPGRNGPGHDGRRPLRIRRFAQRRPGRSPTGPRGPPHLRAGCSRTPRPSPRRSAVRGRPAGHPALAGRCGPRPRHLRGAPRRMAMGPLVAPPSSAASSRTGRRDVRKYTFRSGDAVSARTRRATAGDRRLENRAVVDGSVDRRRDRRPPPRPGRHRARLCHRCGHHPPDPRCDRGSGPRPGHRGADADRRAGHPRPTPGARHLQPGRRRARPAAARRGR